MNKKPICADLLTIKKSAGANVKQAHAGEQAKALHARSGRKTKRTIITSLARSINRAERNALPRKAFGGVPLPLDTIRNNSSKTRQNSGKTERENKKKIYCWKCLQITLDKKRLKCYNRHNGEKPREVKSEIH